MAESLEVGILEKLVASLESCCPRSRNEQACDIGGMPENESEVPNLTGTSPIYDTVIADLEEAVVLDMESIRQYRALLLCRRAWLHFWHQ